MPDPAPPSYSIDTSALLHAWRRAYPPRRFGGLWAAFDELIDGGRMMASIEVYHELERKDDEVFAWAKQRKEAMFLDIDENVQGHVVRLMQAYPKLVDTGKGKSGGDPFVITQALAAAPHLTVVTQEAGGSSNSPRIPFVCDQKGIRHINLLALIEDEDWSF